MLYGNHECRWHRFRLHYRSARADDDVGALPKGDAAWNLVLHAVALMEFPAIEARRDVIDASDHEHSVLVDNPLCKSRQRRPVRSVP